MEIIKHSKKKAPKISLILLDWSVRESFHLLDYLAQQNVPNEWIEIVLVEFYSRKNPKMTEKQREMLDCWIVMNMPTNLCYHKHLMYNCGILHAKGEIITICDSDMMVKPSFIRSILDFFEQQQDAFLHLDQHRSENRKYYPFNYPSFEELDIAINPAPKSLLDPFHQRNYGACFCARKADILAIGGADEHLDYAGHICGPYDLSIRLVNSGKKEVWHNSEFSYHTWHPGSGGVDNYFGPHDGFHFSTTSINYFLSRQVKPHVTNLAIQLLSVAGKNADSSFMQKAIHPSYYESLTIVNLKKKSNQIKRTAKIANFRQKYIAKINAGHLIFVEITLKIIEVLKKNFLTPKHKSVLLKKYCAPIEKKNDEKEKTTSSQFKILKDSYFHRYIRYKTRWDHLQFNLLRSYASLLELNPEIQWCYFAETLFEKYILFFLIRRKNVKIFHFKRKKLLRQKNKQKKLVNLNVFLKNYDELKDDFMLGEITVI